MGMGIRTPGPQHLFARFRTGSDVYYMGTAIAAPEPEEEHYKIPIMNDIGGRSVPLQIVKDGMDAIILGTLNRFDYLVFQTIRALDSSNTPPATPAAGNLNAGSELGGTRGTLEIGVTDFQLIILSEYATTSSASDRVGAIDQPATRIYFSCSMPKYKESTAGTRVLDIAFAIKATSTYNYLTQSFASGNGLAGGGLYSENPTRVGIDRTALLALVSAAGG